LNAKVRRKEKEKELEANTKVEHIKGIIARNDDLDSYLDLVGFDYGGLELNEVGTSGAKK